MSRRTERIAAQLLAELSTLLRREVTDPRVGLVTLTRADVAPDLSHAVIYWSALEVDVEPTPERTAEHQQGLESAAAFLRRRAASALPLRRMPELRFRYDPSFVLAGRTFEVLREVSDDLADARKAPAPDEPAAEGGGDGPQS